MTEFASRLEELLSGMDPARKAELRRLAAKKLSRPWIPNPGPQTEAYLSRADWLLYGGQAGGGKTDLLLGLALTTQHRSVVFRKAYVDLRAAEDRLIEMIRTRDGYNAQERVLRWQGRVLEFGAIDKPGSEFNWQGRPHDFIGFDEGAQLSLQKILYVSGWLRTTKDGVRKRIVIGTNPPQTGDGEWIIEWWAPWLDPLFPNPAAAGELRWAFYAGGKIHWVEGPGETLFDGKIYTHESRTFIPAALDDNPYLKDSGYRARLENMPEPLRSQLLYGDFVAGREDHEWQVIPTAWVKAAQERWKQADNRKRRMVALSVDVALGGNDNIVMASLHEDAWFAPLIRRRAADVDDPAEIAAMMVRERRDEADLSVDATGGWGTGVISHLRHQHGLEVHGIVYSRASKMKARDIGHSFKNTRAAMYWQFREALSPDSEDEVKLPPDPRLLAQLTAVRYHIQGSDVIVIEDKDKIRQRIGSSTDDSDAVVQAWKRRTAKVKTRDDYRVPGLPPVDSYEPKRPPMSGPDAWMLGG